MTPLQSLSNPTWTLSGVQLPREWVGLSIMPYSSEMMKTITVIQEQNYHISGQDFSKETPVETWT